MTRVQQGLTRINGMTLRERVIILLAVAGGVGYLWYAVLLAPLQRERVQLHGDIAAKAQQAAALEAQITRLKKGSGGPVATRRARVAAIRGDIQGLDTRLQQLTGGLIDPSQMSKVLEQMLDRDAALTLVSVESIAAKPLVTAKDQDQPPVAQVYMRGMRIKFRGGYLETLNYLKALEQLPWRLFWGGIQYDVKDYPEAYTTLVVYTLSMQKGWIGA